MRGRAPKRRTNKRNSRGGLHAACDQDASLDAPCVMGRRGACRRLSGPAGADRRRVRGRLRSRHCGTPLCETAVGQVWAAVRHREQAGRSQQRSAAASVARASKDGYTLFMASSTNAVNAITPNLGFDFAKDFAPIALTTRQPFVLVASPSLSESTRSSNWSRGARRSRASSSSPQRVSAAPGISRANFSTSGAVRSSRTCPIRGRARSLPT